MKKISTMLWGIILITLGGLWALSAIGLFEFNIFFDGWWTLFIIVPCFIGLFSENEKLGNIIGILIGGFLLLCAQGILDFGVIWKLAIPIIIILIGLKMIFGSFFDKKTAAITKKMRDDGVNPKSGFAAFSGFDMNLDGEVFNGADLNAIFGGVTCDLRNAIITEDSVINASAVFGGIDIFVPENVNIKVNSNSIFGGVGNKNHKNYKDNAVTIYINATCIFGGLDVK